MRVDGRTVLVTGAASGIGRAMVEAFRAAGDEVIAADIAAGPLAELNGLDRVTTAVADVSQRTQVDTLVDRIVSSHGRLDVVCNNAGIPDRFMGVGECTDEEWLEVIAVNLSGPFYVSRRAVQAMLAGGRGGVIINTASVASFRGGEAGVAYTAAKHGLIGLTRSTTAMYADDGIRCVAICPGPVTTGITKVNAGRRARGELSERGQAVARRTVELRRRWSEPQEIADVAVFVAGPGGVALNGCAIPADSGRMVL